LCFNLPGIINSKMPITKVTLTKHMVVMLLVGLHMLLVVLVLSARLLVPQPMGYQRVD
jgi:hypothetical protein